LYKTTRFASALAFKPTPLLCLTAKTVRLLVPNDEEPYRLDRERSRMSCINFLYSLDLIVYRCVTDPLVHHGRHFGRTFHAMCSVPALLTNGILRLSVLAEEPEETFTHE
jgi:hypothetical protein